MGRLARTFNTMCASIRQAREDLIRQERISTIGRLSGSIVHDLRNPLAAIYGGAEMLVDADLPPAHVKRLAGNIYRASRRIQELLQDLLNVSRGKSRAARDVPAARGGVGRLRFAGRRRPRRRASHVMQSIPPEIELPLERSRMERAFVNLIGNALEAMPEGGEMRISARTRRTAPCWCRCRTTVPGSHPRSASSSSSPSSARANATAWGSDWRCRGRPSSNTRTERSK